jgi:thioredoxin reductase (NADPH)
MTTHDVIIVGAGPSGLTAGLYAGRYKLNALIIGKSLGGWAMNAHKIGNFPGFQEIAGMDIVEKLETQVKGVGVQIVSEEVSEIKKKGKAFLIQTKEGHEYEAKKIIYAAGTEMKKLNVPGERKLIGRGVSYCATCDAFFFKDKNVAVIGGGNAALSAALLLADITQKVYLIHRQSDFGKADPTMIDSAKKHKKIQLMFNEEVSEIVGNTSVESIKLKSGKSMSVSGIFIEIGSAPTLDPIKSLKIKSENGYIVVDKMHKTNVAGFFAVGDITNNALKQVLTAAAEGAIAAYTAHQELLSEQK